jgi:hypothetical protein
MAVAHIIAGGLARMESWPQDVAMGLMPNPVEVPNRPPKPKTELQILGILDSNFKWARLDETPYMDDIENVKEYLYNWELL